MKKNFKNQDLDFEFETCTVGNIDNFWFITRFYTNYEPQKVDFFYFGAIFGE